MPAIETEAELVEVTLNMIALDRTLVGREQPAVEQAGDAIDAGEHFMGKPTGCDVALVAVGTRKGALVGLPAVNHHKLGSTYAARTVASNSVDASGDGNARSLSASCAQ